MAPAAWSPEAPAYLSNKGKKQWLAKFAEALVEAKRNHPENVGAQNAAALKAANSMLAVPAPTSAADIAALDDHHKMLDEVRVDKNGVSNRHCVTSDGRKYSFPVDAKKQKGSASEAE